MNRSSSLVGLFLCALLSACSTTEAPTDAVIVVHAEDADVASEIATVRARLYPLTATREADAIEDRSFVLKRDGESTLSFPFSFVIARGQEPRFLLLISGYRADETEPAIEQKVIASFQSKATVLVDVVLTHACLGKASLCEGLEQTCYAKSQGATAAGECGAVPTVAVVVVAPGQELDASAVPAEPSMDADAALERDGGQADARAPEPDARLDAELDTQASDAQLDATTSTDADTADAQATPDGAANVDSELPTSEDAASEAAVVLVGVATPGGVCSSAGNTTCSKHNGVERLICANGVWTANGSCSGNTRCQTDVSSPDLGTCQPIVTACVDKAPDEAVCVGSERRKCGPDLLDYVENACPPHASCESQTGGVRCVCDAPYMDDGMGGCTVPICMQMPCLNSGICSLAPVGRSCDCSKVDYQGDSCQTKIEDCVLNPCSNGGSCTDGVRTRTCNCSAVDFDGTSCQTKREDCVLNPCSNGGACTDGLRTRTCNCSAVDFDGTSCQTKRDDCVLSPCSNGGTCTDGMRTRSCACVPGFNGTSCETNVNECSGTNVCSGTTSGVAYSFPCVNYTGSTAGYTCQGQFPDWPVPTFGVGRFSWNGDDIADLQTGLHWWRPVLQGFDWAESKTICPSGWRLPTLSELQSLVNYANDPPYETSVFLGMPENYFWTSSPAVGSAGFIWTINFSTGETQAINATNGRPFVRCTR